MHETGTGQQVAQFHERFMMMMMVPLADELNAEHTPEC